MTVGFKTHFESLVKESVNSNFDEKYQIKTVVTEIAVKPVPVENKMKL